MYNNHILHGYRALTEHEAELATKAIDWLASKHLKPEQIVMLTDRNLDREAKVLYAKLETKHLIYYRKIRYQGTDFNRYTTEVLPYLKIKKWIFPNMAWLGRTPTGGFHLHVEAVEKHFQNQHKKVLIKTRKYYTIGVSTKRKTHIQNQLTVGRRIALRA